MPPLPVLRIQYFYLTVEVGRAAFFLYFFSPFFKTSTYPTSSQSTDSGACSRNPCGAFEKLQQSGQANPVLAPPLPHWVKKNNRKRKTITEMVPNPLGGTYIKGYLHPIIEVPETKSSAALAPSGEWFHPNGSPNSLLQPDPVSQYLPAPTLHHHPES